MALLLRTSAFQRRRGAFLVLALALPFALAAAPAGPAHFGTSKYIEYAPGDLPIVLTSPHGGSLLPAKIPDRTKGVTDRDMNTQELARALVDALHAATGQRPHLVLSHLHRRKLDPNRDLAEAANGNPDAERAWREFHAFIRQATAAAVARHGFAFLVDLHGHSHPQARLELGYALNNAQLNQPDSAFNASDLATISTVADLHRRLRTTSSDLIRGPRSLGALFAERGIRSIPSPAEPSPGRDPFFSGGYIVHTHARAPDTPNVDGVQFECYKAGLRDTPENRARFARIAAEVLTIFLRERYGFTAAAPGTGRN